VLSGVRQRLGVDRQLVAACRFGLVAAVGDDQFNEWVVRSVGMAQCPPVVRGHSASQFVEELDGLGPALARSRPPGGGGEQAGECDDLRVAGRVDSGMAGADPPLPAVEAVHQAEEVSVVFAAVVPPVADVAGFAERGEACSCRCQHQTSPQCPRASVQCRQRSLASIPGTGRPMTPDSDAVGRDTDNVGRHCGRPAFPLSSDRNAGSVGVTRDQVGITFNG